MITVMILAGLVFGSSLAIDPELPKRVRLAMKRADLSLDYVSRVTGIPPQRLSDQLNGKTPFTGFWRLFVGEMRETYFMAEFLELEAERINRQLVDRDLGGILTLVSKLVGVTPPPMAKMELPTSYTHEVELPLRGRKAQAS